MGAAWFSFLKFCLSFNPPLSKLVCTFSIYFSISLFIQSVPPHGAEHTTKRGSNLSVSLQITHPAQERLATPSGSTSPTLFEQWCGFFYVPSEPDKWKCCETGPTVFRPYPGRVEHESNRLQMSFAKADLSPQLFKDPESCFGRGLSPQPPAQQTCALPT